jgi:predicted nuclease with TOPRIM domain
MTSAEPARHALYSRLEDVLGLAHAKTLMTHLPQQPSDEVTTKGDLAVLKADVDQRFDQVDQRFRQVDQRFDRLENRFDRLEDRFDRLEGRFDRLEDRFGLMEERMSGQQRFYVATTFGALTAMTAIFSIVVTVVT